MSRKRKNEPELFQRTANSCYCFRQYIDGKNTVINTKTTDYEKAKEFRRNYKAREVTTEISLMQRENASKVAHTIIRAVSGQELDRLTFQAGFDFWLEHNVEFNENTPSYQKQLTGYFFNFAKWCAGNDITHIDEVDASAARRYCGTLRTSKMAPPTYNRCTGFLGRVFAGINAFKHLPNGNPFDRNIVKAQSIAPISEATHQPLEPDMRKKVLQVAAEAGQEWLDFFLVGDQTGMRLKDAALLKWNMIHDGFIEFSPEKTIRHGNRARIPVSPVLAEIFNRRMAQRQASPYVNPVIANFYNTGTWVREKSKDIFEEALGKETTQLSKEGRQRQRNGCIYSYHSFRTTLMSLLASKQVPLRDAMTIFGWESMEMVRIYTKMLEQARGDMDKRNRELFDNLSELQSDVPVVEIVPERLKPTKDALQRLMPLYSNRAIGLIYDISDVAVKNWMMKFGLSRSKRLLSPDLTEEEILKIREELQAA